MRFRAAALALVLALASFGVAAAAPGGKKGKDTSRLQMYEVTVEAAQVDELRRQGFEAVNQQGAAGGIELTLVLSQSQKKSLERQGFTLSPSRNGKGQTALQQAQAQSQFGFDVWRSYDEPGGIRDELYRVAKQNPQLVKLVKLGTTHQGREIIALKVTQGARGQKDGKRPAVLYSSTQHAREWISTEVNRRLLHWFIDKWRANDTAIKNLLKTNELWFVLVANPDGYQYTFEGDRLWRKNLRDNNGDGQITNGDGVDPNRNFPEHWNYDDEGSSSDPASETYRGPAAGSEPETKALIALYDRVPSFKFQVNYHSFGNLLLYSFGWQVQTPSADDPIFVALSGTDADPAVPGFDPGVGADLYATNGETTDYAHVVEKTLAWTPELGEGCPGCGFIFPDDEALIEQEFQNILPFSLDVAKSAKDPDDPESHLGRTTEPFYLDMSEDDPWKHQNPLSDLTFDVSYGDPQPVMVLAKRALGAVSLKYRINGGAVQTKPTSEWNGGERFGGPGDVYYRYMRGNVTGQAPGNTVEVWFTGGGQSSPHFTYTVEEESSAETLIVAAEDYTGASPTQDPNGPHYLDFFTDALSANGVAYEVYDVDAHDRTAPDDLGVLGHFDRVIWYTGDDFLTREPGQPGGTGAATLANTEMLQMRSYINNGGTLNYTGQNAGLQYAFAFDYNPLGTPPYCDNVDQTVDDGCLLLSDDFLQYYLGAYIYNDDAGTDHDTGAPFDIEGVGTPYTGFDWELNGGDGANNQGHTASFITTSSLLPVGTYPQFASTAPAKWIREGPAPFEPFDGTQYMFSQRADISYKRLMRTVTVPANPADARLTFRTSYDTEGFWDHVFVEAHEAGQDDWTTLPDLNGHTSTDPGDSCPAGWHELHPFLEHYQTVNADGSCSPVGSSGTWNASSGRSDGWEEWEVDLSAWPAGTQVEVAISYASDWAIQGLGTWVDAIEGPGGQGTTSFESDMGGWTVPGSPDGSAANPNDWIRTASVGYQEGAATATEDTLYFGFGFEGVRTQAERNELMQRTVGYLVP